LEIAYKKLKPIFEKTDIATGIREGEKLGSVKIPRIGNLKEILELIPDGM